MLKKELRFNKSAEYRTLLSGGKKFSAPHFTAFYRPAAEFQFGVITSKKFSNLAVNRNKSRRLIYRLISEQDLQSFSPHKVLFIPKKGILGEERDVINEEISNFFLQLKSS